MAQAKRIKRKTKPRTAKSPSSLQGLPWSILLMLVVSCLIVVLLVQGALKEDATYGQGLRAILANMQGSESAKSDTNAANAQQRAQPSADQAPMTDFDYYEVLPDIEKIMPSDLPDGALPARELAGAGYFLQIASFTKRTDADALRARLALQGITVSIQAREVTNKGVYYRVRSQTYQNPRNSRALRSELEAMGFKPLLVRLSSPN